MLRQTVRDAAAAPVWEASDPWGLSRSAGADLWRFNAAMRFARDTRRYPYSLEVVIPRAVAGPLARPGAAGSGLSAVEDQVLAIVADRAVLVGVLFTLDDQRFVFYTESPDWTGALRAELRGATGAAVGVNCDRDAGWFEYRSLRKMRDAVDPETFRLIGLCAATAAGCLALLAACHDAWWVAELLIGDVLVAGRWLRGNGLLRSPGPRWRPLAGTGLGVAGVVFPVLAAAGVPGSLALAAGLLAGLALAPAVRLVRARRWRLRR